MVFSQMEEDLKTLPLSALIEQIQEYKNALDTERAEFEEFKSSSKQIEDMMEDELEDAKKEIRDKNNRIYVLQTDLERLQERSDKERTDSRNIENNLKTKLDAANIELSQNRKRIRELEQKNDDLERSDRNNQQINMDLISKLNSAIERTILLESDVVDKEKASEEMYRLRQELKERPRLVVGPMQLDKLDDTPEEPMPHSDNMSPKTALHTSPVPETVCRNEISTSETTDEFKKVDIDGKGFANCVNRIVKDLLVKVDRLETRLSTMLTTK